MKEYLISVGYEAISWAAMLALKKFMPSLAMGLCCLVVGLDCLGVATGYVLKQLKFFLGVVNIFSCK
jgi:hypothetical protein